MTNQLEMYTVQCIQINTTIVIFQYIKVKTTTATHRINVIAPLMLHDFALVRMTGYKNVYIKLPPNASQCDMITPWKDLVSMY